MMHLRYKRKNIWDIIYWVDVLETKKWSIILRFMAWNACAESDFSQKFFWDSHTEGILFHSYLDNISFAQFSWIR